MRIPRFLSLVAMSSLLAESNSKRSEGCKRGSLSLDGFDDAVQVETVLKFIAMGDTPYSIQERLCLGAELRDLDLSSSKDSPAFMIHVGDIKEGSGRWPCDEEAYNDVAEIFYNKTNAINYDPRDCFFVPGDNEWVDCRNPEKAWDFWMKHFGPANPYGFGTLSSGNVKVERQVGVERLPGVNRAENFAFFMDSILFIGLNIVGGAEDFGDEPIRLAQNYEWVKTNLRKYNKKGMKAAALFGHAPLKGVRYQYFGSDFFSLLRKQYPDLPVMYLRGDSHNFCVRYPDPLNQNIVDVEVDGNNLAPPIEVTIKRNRRNDQYAFSIDRRGGLYDPAVGCPSTIEQTWKSPPAKLTTVGHMQDDPDIYPLSACRGTCKKDMQCQPGLSCYIRTASEPIPGCSGAGRARRNYCYDPTSGKEKPKKQKPTTILPPPKETGPANENKKKQKRKQKPITILQPPKESGPANENKKKQKRRKKRKQKKTKPGGTSSVAEKRTPTGRPSQKTNVGLPKLSIVAEDAASYSLGVCEGNCGRTSDCKPGLLCYKRKKEEGESGRDDVPGCASGGPGDIRGKDYCYLPHPDLLVRLGRNGEPALNYPLRRCTGDCDSDKDCQKGLRCYKRRGSGPVPGCRGVGDKGVGYCYDSAVGVLPPPLEKIEIPRKRSPATVPAPVPTRSPTLPRYKIVSWNVVEGDKLGVCKGDCDKDAECEPGLMCYLRHEAESMVPGCVGDPSKKHDYCYRPPANDKNLALFGEGGRPKEVYPLGLCKGDCSDDSDCKGKLKCYHRDAIEIPGCVGRGRKGRGYCYNPKLS